MGTMKKSYCLFAALLLGALYTGCGGSDEDPKSSDDSETNSEVVVDSETESNSEEVDKPSDTTPEKVCDTDPAPVVALDQNFDDWASDDPSFYMAKPDQSQDTDTTSDDGLYRYEDNGQPAVIDGHDAIALHADAMENGNYGFAIEAQFALDTQTDMSCEDFEVSVDVYVPGEYINDEKNMNFQFAFFETANFTPIYSKWWSGSLVADGWATITAKVNTTDGDWTYSGFSKDPDEWIFDAVRVQAILNGTEAAIGDEILIYIDNLRVANFPAEVDTETDAAVDTETDSEEADAGDADAGADAGN